MDPNTVLKELREQCNTILEQYKMEEPDIDVSDEAAELASRFVNLDQWITSGGFIPDDWR